MSANIPDPAEYLVIGTAGHIDHGKTTLVKRLTGVDLDTLPEEQSRKITSPWASPTWPCPRAARPPSWTCPATSGWCAP